MASQCQAQQIKDENSRLDESITIANNSKGRSYLSGMGNVVRQRTVIISIEKRG